MLLKNPDYRESESREHVRVINKSFEDFTPRELVLGHLAWIALLVLAILLRWIS